MGHTISRKSIKKIITILTAAILVLLPVGGSIREVHAEGEESSDSGMSLEHEKTVTENADGTYDLKLTVKGKVNSESSKAPLDVIYVLDREFESIGNRRACFRRTGNIYGSEYGFCDHADK